MVAWLGWSAAARISRSFTTRAECELCAATRRWREEGSEGGPKPNVGEEGGMLSTPCAEKGSASPARAATEGVAGDWLAAGSAMENATECGRARDCDSRVIGL
jgi:hypothetical protein